ncbi:MAG TPA: nucleoside deaminase [Hyphomicrobium sp.]|nr:nucleoside deaminase [Hyphomicrobium sp.]
MTSTQDEANGRSADKAKLLLARRDLLLTGTAAAAASLLSATASFAEVPMSQPKVAHPVTDEDRSFMTMALEKMRQAGVVDKTGGPFGAVVVLNGEVLAVAGNSVMSDNDPSAHAEVNALRAACRKVGSPHLKGAIIYSSCEPCPMCFSTAYWARVAKIFYAASYADYADLFDDANIAKDLTLPYEERQVAMQQIMRPDAQKVWDEFRRTPGGARY